MQHFYSTRWPGEIFNNKTLTSWFINHFLSTELEISRWLCAVSEVPGRQYLRSARRRQLSVPRVRHCMFGSRAFSVAWATVWNSLPMICGIQLLTSIIFGGTHLFTEHYKALAHQCFTLLHSANRNLLTYLKILEVIGLYTVQQVRFEVRFSWPCFASFLRHRSFHYWLLAEKPGIQRKYQNTKLQYNNNTKVTIRYDRRV